MTPKEPTDEEINFVLASWSKAAWIERVPGDVLTAERPDYCRSLDAQIRDLWPRVNSGYLIFGKVWPEAMASADGSEGVGSGHDASPAMASALAIYRMVKDETK